MKEAYEAAKQAIETNNAKSFVKAMNNIKKEGILTDEKDFMAPYLMDLITPAWVKLPSTYAEFKKQISFNKGLLDMINQKENLYTKEAMEKVYDCRLENPPSDKVTNNVHKTFLKNQLLQIEGCKEVIETNLHQSNTASIITILEQSVFNLNDTAKDGLLKHTLHKVKHGKFRPSVENGFKAMAFELSNPKYCSRAFFQELSKIAIPVNINTRNEVDYSQDDSGLKTYDQFKDSIKDKPELVKLFRYKESLYGLANMQESYKDFKTLNKDKINLPEYQSSFMDSLRKSILVIRDWATEFFKIDKSDLKAFKESWAEKINKANGKEKGEPSI